MRGENLNAMCAQAMRGNGPDGHHPASGKPRRIYILGGPGSGKTTLAHQLRERLRLPLHELDEIAFVDFKATLGLGVRRPLAERLAAVAAIAREPEWVCEGPAAGWTAALSPAADLVVWLDVPWHLALRRMLMRYLHAVRFDPLPPSQRRWQLRAFVCGLFVALAPAGGGLAHRSSAVRRALRIFGWWYRYRRGTPWAPLEALSDDCGWSRSTTAAELRPYRAKLLRLRRPAPADDILARWRQINARPPANATARSAVAPLTAAHRGSR
ncbi:MAG TPA: hypothetical protein VFD32_06025 [Dehalococcoidia bacterium]|nr:hypothetical protein [Dehalococcoidia bacterium]